MPKISWSISKTCDGKPLFILCDSPLVRKLCFSFRFSRELSHLPKSLGRGKDNHATINCVLWPLTLIQAAFQAEHCRVSGSDMWHQLIFHKRSPVCFYFASWERHRCLSGWRCSLWDFHRCLEDWCHAETEPGRELELSKVLKLWCKLATIQRVFFDLL